jgi:hypothetical protein
MGRYDAELGLQLDMSQSARQSTFCTMGETDLVGGITILDDSVGSYDNSVDIVVLHE